MYNESKLLTYFNFKIMQTVLILFKIRLTLLNILICFIFKIKQLTDFSINFKKSTY